MTWWLFYIPFSFSSHKSLIIQTNLVCHAWLDNTSGHKGVFPGLRCDTSKGAIIIIIIIIFEPKLPGSSYPSTSGTRPLKNGNLPTTVPAPEV